MFFDSRERNLFQFLVKISDEIYFWSCLKVALEQYIVAVTFSACEEAHILDFLFPPPSKQDIWDEARIAVVELQSLELLWDMIERGRRGAISEEDCMKRIKALDQDSCKQALYDLMASYQKFLTFDEYSPLVSRARLVDLVPHRNPFIGFPTLLEKSFELILSCYFAPYRSVPYAVMYFCRNVVESFRDFVRAIEGNSFRDIIDCAEAFDQEMDVAIDEFLKGVLGGGSGPI